MSPRKKRYAQLRAGGASRSEAVRKAGGKRSRARQLGYEWEQDPRVQAEIAKLIEKEMDAPEVRGRLAAQARGQLATKTVVNAKGKARREFDTLGACDKVARIHRLYREDGPPPVPPSSAGTLTLNLPQHQLLPLAKAALAVLQRQPRPTR